MHLTHCLQRYGSITMPGFFITAQLLLSHDQDFLYVHIARLRSIKSRLFFGRLHFHEILRIQNQNIYH